MCRESCRRDVFEIEKREEQIAKLPMGCATSLANASLSPNWKAMANRPAMPNICLPSLNYRKLLGWIAGTGS
jgi:hypothetical protein